MTWATPSFLNAEDGHDVANSSGLQDGCCCVIRVAKIKRVAKGYVTKVAKALKPPLLQRFGALQIVRCVRSNMVALGDFGRKMAFKKLMAAIRAFVVEAVYSEFPVCPSGMESGNQKMPRIIELLKGRSLWECIHWRIIDLRGQTAVLIITIFFLGAGESAQFRVHDLSLVNVHFHKEAHMSWKTLFI